MNISSHRSSSMERKAMYSALFMIFLFVSPLFVLGEDAHIRLHDNLDSNIAWYKVLIHSGEWFGDVNGKIDQVINGIPRNTYGTEFSGIVLLHALFPSMLAYAWSQTITRIVAFFGMYLLLRRRFITSGDAWPIRILVSLAFALTPFWPSGMLSTLGHPLALWAFLNIRQRQASWKEWLTLGLLPFYSSFVLGFFFFLFGMGLLWLWDVVAKRRWNVIFLSSILFMTTIYLLTEYRLLYSVVFSEATSRNEFFSSKLDLWTTVRLTVKNFVQGHNHVATLHKYMIFPFTWFILYWCGARYLQERKLQDPLQRRFLLLMLLNALLSLWYAFWFHSAWQPLKEQIHLLNTFNFARFHFLRPTIIYLAFALACMLLWQFNSRGSRKLVWIILFAQLLLLIGFNDEIKYRTLGTPSFKQFYAEEQFREIRKAIGKPVSTYRVASIGLHPAIAQYNGFYTLDTYNNFYPLTYKHRFRQIIAEELDKNPKLKEYFDTWGGRCYIFVDELGKKYDYTKRSRKSIHQLELNMAVFRSMGGQYLFSAVPIHNAAENQLELIEIFEHQDSAWKVYVYQVHDDFGG